MRILVTDGNLRSTLAAVRSLGNCGAEVIVGEKSSASLAGASRYCHGKLQYPDPIANPCEFKAFILAQAGNREFDVLLPVSDITSQLIAQIREQLPKAIIMLSPRCQQLLQAIDKRRTLLSALEVNVPIPETHMLCEDDCLEEIAGQLSYPVVIKPRFSWLYRDGNWANGMVEFAYSPEELNKKYNRIHATNPYPLVQRRLEGEGKGVFLLVWNGELKAAFAHRRLREKPPWGGVSTYCESIPLDDTLVSGALSLLRHMNWNGVAMVEFKVDRADRIAKLMEVNGRLWGSLQLAVDAGVNFPALLYRLALGEDVSPQLGYKFGVRSRWFWGDFDQLVIQLKSRSGAIPGAPSKLRAALDFMKLIQPNTRYDVFRLSDPGPGWFETRTYLCENLGWSGKHAN